MSLDKVKKEILQKAEKEADSIISRGKKEAEEMMKKADEEAEEYRKNSEEENRKVIERMEKKTLASADFDIKKMKLDKKKEMIDMAFENARKRLQDMSDKDKEARMKKLLEKAKKEIDVGTVYSSPEDRKIVQKIVQKMPGVKCSTADISGGIIAESKGGEFSVDMSYDELLEEVKKKYLQEIAAKLFG
ncbi:MAG: V-type ATP synthase subunit E family protein [Candidatus Woesearchaeota archaeon]